jgi:hypothetical protein
MVHFTRLTVSRSTYIYIRMIVLLMNNELERIWKEVIMV